MSEELRQLREAVAALSRQVVTLEASSAAYYHRVRFILLPLHLGVVFGGRFLLAGAGLMNIRAFSLMAMAFTILCLVADLVCYLQYVRLSGNPFIRASSARNPLVAAIEFIVKNVLLRLTPYVVVWYLLSFGYLLGLYRFHSGTLPPAFHQFYASVVAPPNPAAAPATLRVPVSRSAVRRTRMTPEGKCKGGPQWTEFLQ